MINIADDKVVHILRVSSRDDETGEDTVYLFLDADIAYDALLRMVASVRTPGNALDEDVDREYAHLKSKQMKEDDLMLMFGETTDWSRMVTWDVRTILAEVPGEVLEGVF